MGSVMSMDGVRDEIGRYVRHVWCSAQGRDVSDVVRDTPAGPAYLADADRIITAVAAHLLPVLEPARAYLGNRTCDDDDAFDAYCPLDDLVKALAATQPQKEADQSAQNQTGGTQQ
jgi:hypothetical protein